MSENADYLKNRRRVNVSNTNVDLDGEISALITELEYIRDSLGAKYYDIQAEDYSVNIEFERDETEEEYETRLKKAANLVAENAARTKAYELDMLKKLKAKYECVETRSLTL